MSSSESAPASDATPEPDPRAGGSDVDGIVIPPDVTGDTFPVVGIGASAGGLKAFQEFFSALPAQPGMAFVLVQHLSPDHESALASLIQSKTQMEVTQVTDHPDVEPNRVYVIPPGKHLEIEGGHLQLTEAQRDRGRPAAVDHFFRSLADQMGERAVCVVLSGTGSDGSLGLKAVKERAGLTMAQTPSDAEYDGMPRSAIDTDLVDVQGTAAELAQKLVAIRDSSGRIALPESERDALPENDHQALQAIFAHLRQRTAHDFAHYKRATILRGLARRLQVTGQATLPEYAGYLRQSPDEVQALLRDFLISVTQFFRDTEAFEVLERDTIPALFHDKGPSDQVRVWVAGCATGEEAYSIAMLLCEHRDRLDTPPDLQVFATDIDEDALARAREGVYAEVAAADVSAERLRRFFDVEGSGVRVKPALRQMVLFARHNLLSDPPFSRLDLVACRNVLIYLNRAIQGRVFATFHYALRPDSWLFLGSAEGPEVLSKGFTAADKPARIYRRRDATGLPRMPFRAAGDGRRGMPPTPTLPAPPPREGLVERYRDWTLEQYAPPRLLVDEHYDVTHVFGDAGAYLVDREGPVSQNVVDKVLRAFRIDLRAALFRAFSAGAATDTPFKRVEVGGRERVTRLHVGPVGGPAADDGQAEVVFVELDPATVTALGASVPDDRGGAPADDASVTRLEGELREVRQRLQLTVEESETSTEELRASNEELQSINEELQSTTEELETSKEELQSTNEELQTVNQELKVKVDELLRVNSDLHNLISSTEIATLFLDRSLKLKRYTPRAADLFHVIPSDVGRPFEHLSHRLRESDFPQTARRVLDTLQPQETEIQDDDGRWYSARLSPYRTTDDRIDGVVLTLVDVTEPRRARDEADRRATQQRAVAALGLAALEGEAESALFGLACEHLAQALDAPLAKVLRWRPDDGDLLLEAGVGWHEGLVGQASVSGSDGQAGYTLAANEPVLVEDLEAEGRLSGPPLLTDHGVRSGISVAIAGRDGQPWGVLGVHDVTPRSFSPDDAEFVQSVANVLSDALRRNENERTIRTQLAEIEAVYGTAPVGLAFYDRELRYRRINDRLADINGVAVEDHIGKNVRDVLPSLADQLEPILEQVFETGEPVLDLEIQGSTLSDPDPERTWLCSYVPEVVDGAVDGVSVVVRDITDRKRAEAERTAALDELAFVLEGAHVGVWSRDLASGAVALDERAQAITGTPAQSSVADIDARLHPDDVDASRAAVEQATSGALGQLRVTQRINVDGDWRWLDVIGRFVPGRGDQGTLTGIVVDVTDLRRAESDLRALTASLEARVVQRTAQVRGLAAELTRAEEAERQRIALVLHDDLQQILFAVQVKMALVDRSLPEGAPAHSVVEQAETLLGQAIQAARTLSVDLSPPVLHSETLAAALDWLGHRVQETHGLAVTIEGDADVDEDLRTLLVRAASELLFNVSKHAGTDRATVTVSHDGGVVRVVVADDGAGFDADHASDAGFGLASVRRRLTLIGGSLSVDSAPGEGTRVTLTTPTLLDPDG